MSAPMFLNPLGLLALLGVPAVIALHFFRRRFQPRVVSALFLWESPTSTSLSGRRRERLLTSKSFWAELLLALLLGLAIAGPRACSGLEAQHLVIVLDTSASMGARPGLAPDESTPTFADEATERITTRIEALPSGSRITLVASGARPKILAGPGAFPEEALAELARYPQLVTAGRHDLEPATSLALQLAGEGAVTLFTDHFEPERYPAQVGIVALGRATRNLAITRATRIKGGEAGAGGERVLVTVANFSQGTALTRVTLSVAGKALSAQGLELEAGARRHFSFDVPADTPALRASLEPDALALDNEALLVSPPTRTLSLGSTLDEQEERALGLTSSLPEARRLDRLMALVEDSARATDLESAQLITSAAPSGGPRTWCLVLHPARGEALDLVGPFLIEKRHPLMNGVSLDGVVWSASQEVELPGVPLISAGNRPLMTEERDGARSLYHLNLNVARSSLQRSPDWPILLDNLAELRRGELQGAERCNLAMGESFRFRDIRPAEYSLQLPNGAGPRRLLRARGSLVIEDLDRVGLYTLERDGRALASFAVHFGDGGESDLTALSQGERASLAQLAEEQTESSWVVLLLASLALCALLIDWCVLRPQRVASPDSGVTA